MLIYLAFYLAQFYLCLCHFLLFYLVPYIIVYIPQFVVCRSVYFFYLNNFVHVCMVQSVLVYLAQFLFVFLAKYGHVWLSFSCLFDSICLDLSGSVRVLIMSGRICFISILFTLFFSTWLSFFFIICLDGFHLAQFFLTHPPIFTYPCTKRLSPFWIT